MWNPASLTNIGTTEASFSILGSTNSEKFNKTFSVQDITFEADVSGTSNAFTGGFYFDVPAKATSKQTREAIGQYTVMTESSGITYQQALRLNDWLTAGVIYRGPIDADLNIVGDFPTTVKYTLDMTGASLEGTGMWFDANNKISYNYTIPGTSTTVTSTSASAVWNNFITQEAVVPLTSYAEFRNNVTVDSNLTACLAGKFNNLSVGVNMTPIAAEMNIDNALRTIVNAGTADITLYTPDFDTNSSESIAQWFSDSSKYGASAGYKTKISKVPDGESVADGKYRGFYTASAMRMDLGASYDVSDYLRIGLAYENINAASLNFSGAGRSTYAQTRLGTVEFSDVLDPAQNKLPAFFKDTFSVVEGTEGYYLEPTKNYNLPQKLRMGMAIIKPIVIAIDYETQLNPIKYFAQDVNGDYNEVKISNINMIRIGMDFYFIKAGTTLLLRPSFSGIDANTQSNINKAFKYGALPLKIDLGSTWNLWGFVTDSYVGFNAMSILDILQFNTLSTDLSKLLYYGIAVNKSFWTVSYLANIDPGATGAAYYAAKETNSNKSFEYGDIKWISTLQITYRF